MWRAAVSSEHIRLYFAAAALARRASGLEASLAALRAALGTPAAADAVAALTAACKASGCDEELGRLTAAREPFDEHTAQLIVPGLYLGPLMAAESDAWLELHGVTAVLDTTGGWRRKSSALDGQSWVREPPPPPGRRQHLQLPAEDRADFNIEPLLRRGVDFIREAIGAGGCVLVHCHAGVSRSATLAAAYLMEEHALSVRCALRLLTEARPCCRPNPGFEKALVGWEMRVRVAARARSAGGGERVPSGGAKRPRSPEAVTGAAEAGGAAAGGRAAAGGAGRSGEERVGGKTVRESGHDSGGGGAPSRLCVVAACASSKGRKTQNEDVPLLLDSLKEGRALYGVLDGHGGRDVAEWVSRRLPELLCEQPAASAPVKEALRRAFVACDSELVLAATEQGWCDGCCATAALLELDAAPPRAYVANLGAGPLHRHFLCLRLLRLNLPPFPPPLPPPPRLLALLPHFPPLPSPVPPPGDSRAYACVVAGSGPARTVSLSKGDHSPLDAAERKRIVAAGGHVEGGRLCGSRELDAESDSRVSSRETPVPCSRLSSHPHALSYALGSLEVSRAFGDVRLKPFGLIATPDVVSFKIGRETEFILLACDGLWRVFSGVQAVEWLRPKLCDMDRRRAALVAQLGSATAVAALTREAHASLLKEREAATEEGVLRELVRVAVQERNARDNVTAVLVRFAWPEAES